MVHPRRKISGPANALQRAGDRILAARWMGGDLTLVRVVRDEDERLRRRGTALCHPERAQRVERSAPSDGTLRNGFHAEAPRVVPGPATLAAARGGAALGAEIRPPDHQRR
jgi:hypothetical protein